MQLASWLVFELNPNDNHGLRWDLSQAYMLHGRDNDALKLNQLYPHDSSPVLDMNRVLAYYRLGDLAQAKEALIKARLDHPKVIAMLLKPRPKPVKPDEWGVTVGGAYEAWLYVQPHHPLWLACGALEVVNGGFFKISGLHSVRVDGGEIKFSRNQEDNCPDSNNSFEAACAAFGGRE